MAVDVVQRERSNIKRYASDFSNILIGKIGITLGSVLSGEGSVPAPQATAQQWIDEVFT